MSTEMEKETVQKLSAAHSASQQTKFGLAVHDVARIKDLEDKKVKVISLMTKGKAFYHYKRLEKLYMR